ncbi:MAG: hypothetical protein WC760_11245 [Bacteroidia bacterium]|jgi:hypothetical protein
MNTQGKIGTAFIIAFAITMFISWKFYGHDVATLSFNFLLLNAIMSRGRQKKYGALLDLRMEIAQIFAVPGVLSIYWFINWFFHRLL